MRITPLRVALCAIGLLIISYSIFIFNDQRSYRAAVEEDARDRGYPVDSIRSYSTWPLEYYEPALRQIVDPQSAEAIVSDADSVAYYLLPAASNEADGALVQVFYFQLASRLGGLSVTYSPAHQPWIEGIDWKPGEEHRTNRRPALDWFDAVSSRSEQKLP